MLAALLFAAAPTAGQANATGALAPTTVVSSADDIETDFTEAEAVIEEENAAALAKIATPAALKAKFSANSDSNFRNLFGAMKKMDSPAAPAISIPSLAPIQAMALSSSFGMRTHPILRKRKRHNGVDIPSPTGTPIYASADGFIGRAQWVNGYGKYVEIEHGNEIQTRYGHMSRIAVSAGQAIKRGDIIGYVGSTGRSTGPHLHYEVRISGTPVNPMPFIQSDTQIATVTGENAGMGGPN